MNLPNLTLLWLLLPLAPLKAASFLFSFRPDSVVAEQDPYYYNLYKQPDGSSLDTTSRIYTSTSVYNSEQPNSPTDRLTATMSGVGYDSDPQRGTEWGLLDPASPEFSEKPESFNGYVLKYGIRPNAVGSQVSNLKKADGAAAAASYLKFNIEAGDDVLFGEVSLFITDLQAIEPTDVAWAGTSWDGYSTPIIPVLTRDLEKGTETLTFTWDNIGAVTKDLELRVFGIKGADYGNFSAGILRGTIDPPPVPEHNSMVLAGMFLWAGILKRRRNHRA